MGDCFWYIICHIFKKGKADIESIPYSEYEEAYLDRIAANYVSYTLLEDVKGIKEKHKERFFRTFYDTMAQSVFYSLFYAYPKSRSQLNDETKRMLLNVFSYMFTGMEIKSAKFEHWDLDLGTGNILTIGAKKKQAKQLEAYSLADID